MKFKTIKLNKKQIEEIKNLKEASGAAYAAFEHSSTMLNKANRDFWKYVRQHFPKVPKEKVKFNRETNTFEYYEYDEEK